MASLVHLVHKGGKVQKVDQVPLECKGHPAHLVVKVIPVNKVYRATLDHPDQKVMGELQGYQVNLVITEKRVLQDQLELRDHLDVEEEKDQRENLVNQEKTVQRDQRVPMEYLVIKDQKVHQECWVFLVPEDLQGKMDHPDLEVQPVSQVQGEIWVFQVNMVRRGHMGCRVHGVQQENEGHQDIQGR